MLLLLILLQAFQVLVLWTHDWIPLGRLNDVQAIHAGDTRARLVRVTLIQSVPYTIGLCLTLTYLESGRPPWVWDWLWVSYVLLFMGEIRAWWWPYLVQSEPVRAERYRQLFGATHALLPVRNGMVPNTLHTSLHLATACTLAVLWMLTQR